MSQAFACDSANRYVASVGRPKRPEDQLVRTLQVFKPAKDMVDKFFTEHPGKINWTVSQVVMWFFSQTYDVQRHIIEHGASAKSSLSGDQISLGGEGSTQASFEKTADTAIQLIQQLKKMKQQGRTPQ